VALVHERTIPNERPPLVGEVSANFCGYRGVAWSVRRIPYGRNLGFIDRLNRAIRTKIGIIKLVKHSEAAGISDCRRLFQRLLSFWGRIMHEYVVIPLTYTVYETVTETFTVTTWISVKWIRCHYISTDNSPNVKVCSEAESWTQLVTRMSLNRIRAIFIRFTRQ
jgi:hypothetical protein